VLEPDACLDPEPGRPDRVYAKRAGFLDESAIHVPWARLQLDPDAFGDPLEHLLLAAGIRAWDQAVTDPLDPRRVGLAVGNIVLPTAGASRLSDAILGRAFVRRLERQTGIELPDPIGFEARASDRWVAGRPLGLLAKALGLGGPQWSLDAACASSLFALELAVRALQAGRIDAALAGGVSRPDPLYTQMGFSQLRALSKRGRCAPFDARGDGLVVGEGAGLFVLKRLADALDHGDRVHAVIVGIGASNDVDGRLLAPSEEGQLRAMRAAYREAGWRPSDVDLIECHATGTPTGDAVEFASLRTLWSEEPRDRSCALGAVKANVGHLLTAAGAAALAKVLLCLEHESLVPVANFQSPGPSIPLADAPLRIPTACAPWTTREDTPRRAALSGFGFGGTNAHVLLQQYVPDAPVRVFTPAPPITPVAVVGLGGRVGPWASARELFPRLLGAGRAIEPTPSPSMRDLPDPPRGHFIDAIDIERGAFSIPPRELEACLPQQILMLDVAERAWRDAGEPDLSGPRTGVYVGVGLDLGTTDYHLRWSLRRRARAWAEAQGRPTQGPVFEGWLAELTDAIAPALDANRTMGGLGSIVASRIARRFQIGGPSYVLSTEDGSGLAALDAAVDALRRGVIDRALVGAVDLTSDARAWMATASTVGLSDSTITASLLPDADGPVAADGAIAVVLQRTDDAAPEHTYAVIEGVGGASGGRDEPFGPDAPAYVRSLREALTHARTRPADIGWVCADGSGRPGADGTEIRGLLEVFGETPPVTAAPASVGHCGAASGLVSFAQACLGLSRRVLPGVPGDRSRRGGLRTPGATPRPWPIDRDGETRRAAVASLGVGGACHHVIVRASDHDGRTRHLESLPLLDEEADALFVVETDGIGDLEDGLRRLAAIGADAPTRGGSELARGWAAERGRAPAASLGLAVLARNGDQLSRLATAALEHMDDPEALRRQTAGRVVYANEPVPGEVAFVYPGSGSHFPGMGRSLALHFPEVLRELEDSHRRVRSQLQSDLMWDADAARIDADPRGLILGQVSLGTVATRVLQAFGLKPQAAIGYSLGETAALFGLGAWQARDEMLRRAETSPLFSTHLAGPCAAARRQWALPDDVDVQWMVGVVDADADAVRDALTGLPRAALLIVNTPHQCVVGGHGPQVETLAERLGVELHRLHGITTVHCDVVAPVADDYREFHRLPTQAPDGIRFYSGNWGEAYPVDQDRAADSITANAVSGLDFPRTIRRAWDDGVRHFIEVGPGASCSRMIAAILGDRPHTAVSMSNANGNERNALLRVLATAIAHRIPIDTDPLWTEPTVPGEAPLRNLHRIPTARTPTKTLPAPPNSVSVSGSGSGSVPEVPAQAGPDRWTDSYSDSDRGLPFVGPAQAAAAAHASFLRLSARRQRLASELLGRILPAAAHVDPAVAVPTEPAANEAPKPTPPVVFDREQCLQFATGSIVGCFGEAFAEVDGFPTRVRLPDEPLMLVDRVTVLEGKPGRLGPGRIVTEHDVRPGSWYLDSGRIPTAVLIESGQADLMLSAWLGIDFETRGRSMYRLLDATVTFHDALPRVGQVVRHDIRIERFFQQSGTWLFRFHFESSVDGKPLVSMRDGCAGFFSPDQLSDGQGVVQGRLEAARSSQPSWTPPELVDVPPMTMDGARLDRLRAGDLVGAFGPDFEGLQLHAPLTLPSGKLRLLDRVTALEPVGGDEGLGRIVGEYDVHPDDWFLTCHFVDDNVMPGTLMYECCMHVLRVLLLRRGWVAESGESAFEPIIGVRSRLRCRGQVLPDTKVVGYEILVRRYVEGPEPAVICDARMYADGKWIVDIGDMAVRLSGTTWEALQRRWASREPSARGGPGPLPAVYGPDRIVAFTEGNPSEAFGEPYRPFDRDRPIARLPRAPLCFIDRITAVSGEPFAMKAGATAQAQVEIPADAWYFEANRQREIPFFVLLEMALQPCGWLAAYIGSALTSEERLRFRNLGGEATLLRPVEPDDLLTTDVTLTAVSHAGGMIIQHFEFEVLARDRGPVYRGKTYFGFFTDDALRDQVGIRDAELDPAGPAARGPFELPREAPLPAPKLRMIEAIDALELTGGHHGLGRVEGHVDVDPAAWFFEAHFHQDPVWPGSLGLESFLQLLKAWASERWSLGPNACFSTTLVDRPHRWSYRGQVTPDAGRVTVQASLRAVEGDPTGPSGARIEAQGYLSVDGRVIYHIERLGLTVHDREGS
jgi:acyl transferase domain-containing protein/3-hydroxymyristoyl/3-hydroxydecanoyl-(acyl carrier protein) dehydratase